MKKLLLLLVLSIGLSSFVSAYTISVSYEVCVNVQVKIGETCTPKQDYIGGPWYDDCQDVYETQKKCTTETETYEVTADVSIEDIAKLIEDMNPGSDLDVTVSETGITVTSIETDRETTSDLLMASHDVVNTNDSLTTQEKFTQIQTELQKIATKVGDPVRISVGDFITKETDISLQYINSLIELERSYLSTNETNHSLGTSWIFNYDTRIVRGVKFEINELVLDTKNTISSVEGLISSATDNYATALEDINGVIEQSNSIVEQIEDTISALQNALSGSLHSKIRPRVESDLANAQSKLAIALAFLHRAEDAKQDILDSYINIENMHADLAILNDQLAVLEDEARLANANSSLNEYVLNSSDPSFYQYTGNKFVILIDEGGSPNRYELLAEPVYNTTDLYSNGSPNFYPNGSMTESVQPSDNTLELLSDGSFLLTKKDKTKHNYSLYGQLTEIEDPNGNSLEFAYDNLHRLVKITDDFGREIVITRSGDKITAIGAPDGSSVSYGYDSSGHLSSVTDTEGDTVQYSYYSTGEIEKIIKPDGSFRQYNYITQNGKQVVESTVDEEGDTEYFYYHFDEGYTEYVNAAGVSEFHYYDDRNRETKVVYSDGSYIENTYDDDNNMTSTRSRTGYITDFEYDESSNITRIDYPDGTYETRSYSSFSKLTEMRDPDGNRIVND